MRILIAIPTHNEELVLADSMRELSQWLDQNLSAHDWRIVIADNGSSDRTPEIGRALETSLPRLNFWHTDSPGRGQALRRVWSEAADDDVLVYMDVDLAVKLEALKTLIAAIEEGADVAIGSRFLPGSIVDRSLLREITSRGYITLAKALLSLKFSDAQCGFKAIRADSFRRLLVHSSHPGWFFDTELLLLAQHAGMKVVEVPVDWVEKRDRRRKSTVKLTSTIAGYLGDMLSYRVRLPRITAELQAGRKPRDPAEGDS